MTGHPDSPDLVRSLHFSRALLAPHRWLLIGIGLVLLIETAASLSLPLLAGVLTERLLDNAGGPTDFYPIGLLVVAALLVQLGSRIAGRLGMASIGDEILLDLRQRTFAHLQRLPLTHHDQHKRGDQLSLLTTDAQSLSSFLSGALPGLLPMLLTLTGAMGMLMWLRPGLALLIVLAVAGGVTGLKFWMRTINRRARDWYDAQSETVAVAEQAIELLPIIKAEAQEQRQQTIYGQAATAARARARRLRHAVAPLQPIVQLVSLAGIVILLLIAAGPGSTQPAAPGELVTLLLYGVLIARPLAALADLYGHWSRARAALSRILETLAREPESESAGHRPPKRLESGIRFDRVTFGYEPDQPVLQDFDLEIRAGERLALTGSNGSGKTTLIGLLMRFYTPQSGRILIDDRPIDEFRLDALRRSVALVPQRVWLFQGSIGDNIRLGWPDAPMARVEQAAELAGAAGFIDRTPAGYETQLGPRGARISGGQQQRLALARALLRPTPILIFDEATSMFDDEGERALIDRIGPAVADRTVVFITHRPALLALADRVVNLGGAKPIPTSSHIRRLRNR